MCGIVGCLAKFHSGFNQKDVDIFTQMLYVDALRGWDATGVVGVDKNGNVDIKKSARAAGPFVSTANYKAFTTDAFQKYQMMIGHNRKATHGEKRHEDAHPFWDEDEKIVLVHNGMIHNHKEFCKDATVDSAAITNALAKGDIDDIISRVSGAFVFIWYNIEEKRMYFIRNDLRPLNIAEANNQIFFASEEKMLTWITSRNDVTINKSYSLKPMTLYTFDFATRVLKEERYIEKKPLPALPPPKTGGGSNIISITNQPWTGKEKKHLFLTEEDFKTQARISDAIKMNEILPVWYTHYEVLNGRTVKLFANVMNVENVDDVEILLFVNKDVFQTLDLTMPHYVTISNIVHNNGKTTIYVRGSEAIQNYYITENDIVVSIDMWRDPHFPAVCDICGDLVKYSNLDQAEVLVVNPESFVLVCPVCSGKGTHV